MAEDTTARTLPVSGTWTIDPAHTVIGFRVRHLMAATVRGSFKSFSGKIHIGDSPEDSRAEVAIDAASIDTGVEDRDRHLRSQDFLDAATHPTLDFASREVRPVSDGRYQIEGDLTIRGESRPVTLELDYLGLMTDPWGNDKALFSATTSIDREAWGLTWNAPLQSGGWLVGKTVDIELEIQASAS